MSDAEIWVVYRQIDNYSRSGLGHTVFERLHQQKQ